MEINNNQALSNLGDQLDESLQDTKILVSPLFQLKLGLFNGFPNVFLCLSALLLISLNTISVSACSSKEIIGKHTLAPMGPFG